MNRYPIRSLALLVILSLVPLAVAQPKGYRVPEVDLKQQLIWGASCEGPDGFVLGFGGQDQKADEVPRTRVKSDGQWKSPGAELREKNPLQKQHERCQALVKQQKDLAARARLRFFEGVKVAEGSKPITADLFAGQSRLVREASMLLTELEKLAVNLQDYEAGQVCRARLKLAGVTAQGNARPARLLTNGKLVDAVRAMTLDQIALEQAAEALDAEPPARFLSPLIYDAKTKLFVLFGGDHGDYLTNDTWIFDPARRKWEQRHAQASPAPRGNHILKAGSDGLVTMSGGHAYTSSTSYCGAQYRAMIDGDWTYDIAANTWKSRGKAGPSEMRVYRTGPFHPDFFCEGPAPDALAVKKELGNIPSNRWVEMKPPQKPEMVRTWGTAVFDPDGDRVLIFSGGHSAHGGSDVLHYHLATNRWELPCPVEFPLGQLYSNTSYPEGFNLNRRPWVTGHTYQSYGYDSASKRMYFVGQTNHCFVYDPAQGDWIGRIPKPERMIYNDCYYTLVITPTPRGLFCWTGRGDVFHLAGAKPEWQQFKTTGARLPSSVVDHSTVVHDSKRDRLVFFRSDYGKKYEGEVHALDLKSGTVTRLIAKNSAALAVLGLKEFDRAVYDPHSELAIFATLLPGDVSKVRRSLAYDCAADRWVTLNIDHEIERGKRPVYPRGEGHSCGLMFDTRRRLIWGVDTHQCRVYALRFEPKAADVRVLE